jgi:hypothetical protein
MHAMRSISELQKALKAAAARKFPDSVWGESERIASIQRQLDDVKAAIEVERGERTSDDHAHQNPDHRIAALIADILIFAEERGTDTEHELEKVLAWFENRA